MWDRLLGIGTVFDWISPLVQTFETFGSRMQTMSVGSVQDIETIRAAGVKVGRTPFYVSGEWCITVSNVDRALAALGQTRHKELTILARLIRPADDWRCQYCGNLWGSRQRKCANCGAPRR